VVSAVSDRDLRFEEDIDVKAAKKAQTPFLYKVFLINDDYTTMEFVVYILEKIFHKPPPEATQIMLNVHKSGVGMAGVYTREIAETKISKVHEIARENKFPLKCLMERE
jgi:ATP-dependent Clp protease adaptor protein ClpS